MFQKQNTPSPKKHGALEQAKKYSITPFNISSLARGRKAFHSSITVKETKEVPKKCQNQKMRKIRSFHARAAHDCPQDPVSCFDFIGQLIVQNLELTEKDQKQIKNSKNDIDRGTIIKLTEAKSKNGKHSVWRKQEENQIFASTDQKPVRSGIQTSLEIPFPKAIFHICHFFSEYVVEVYSEKKRQLQKKSKSVHFIQGWISSLNSLYYCIDRVLLLYRPLSSDKLYGKMNLSQPLLAIVESQHYFDQSHQKIILFCHAWFVELYTYSNHGEETLFSPLHIKISLNNPAPLHMLLTKNDPVKNPQKFLLIYEASSGSLMIKEFILETANQEVKMKVLSQKRIMQRENSNFPNKLNEIYAEMKRRVSCSWICKFGLEIWEKNRVSFLRKTGGKGNSRKQDSEAKQPRQRKLRGIFGKWPFIIFNYGLVFQIFSLTSHCSKTMRVKEILDENLIIGIPAELKEQNNLQILQIFEKSPLDFAILLNSGSKIVISLTEAQIIQVKVKEILLNPLKNHGAIASTPSLQNMIMKEEHKQTSLTYLLNCEENSDKKLLSIAVDCCAKYEESYLHEVKGFDWLIHATDEGYESFYVFRYCDWICSVVSAVERKRSNIWQLAKYLIEEVWKREFGRSWEEGSVRRQKYYEERLEVYVILEKALVNILWNSDQIFLIAGNNEEGQCQMSFIKWEQIPNKTFQMIKIILEVIIANQEVLNREYHKQEGQAATMCGPYSGLELSRSLPTEVEDDKGALKMRQSQKVNSSAILSSMSRFRSRFSTGAKSASGNSPQTDINSELIMAHHGLIFAFSNAVETILREDWVKTRAIDLPIELIEQKLSSIKEIIILTFDKLLELEKTEENNEGREYLCRAWSEGSPQCKVGHFEKKQENKAEVSSTESMERSTVQNHRKRKVDPQFQIILPFIDHLKQLLFIFHISLKMGAWEQNADKLDELRNLTLSEAFKKPLSYFHQFLFWHFIFEHHPNLFKMYKKVIPNFLQASSSSSSSHSQLFLKCLHLFPVVCPLPAKKKESILSVIHSSFERMDEIPPYFLHFMEKEKGLTKSDLLYYDDCCRRELSISKPFDAHHNQEQHHD